MVAETISTCAPLIGFPFRPVYTRVAVCFDFLTAVHEGSIEDSGSVCTLSRRRPARAAEQREAARGGAPGQDVTEPLSSILLPFFVIYNLQRFSLGSLGYL